MRTRTGRAIFAIIASAVCGLASVMTGTPALANKADDTLHFASVQTVPSLDKYFSTGTTALMLAHAIWDTLIYRDPESGEFRGDLATAWRWMDDRTLEIDLRQGVKFHNGAAFDADDVVSTLRFAADPNNKNVAVRLVRWIDRIEKVGPYQVRIVTKGPFPTALGYLASPVLPIYPHAYYEAVGPKGMGAKPVGTGPYRVTDYAVGKFVRLERNPDYFKDSPKVQPKIGKIEVRFIPDPQTQVAEIVAGGLDLVLSESRDQAEQLRELPRLRVLAGETRWAVWLSMNTLDKGATPQLRDIRVRQAISYAIDRDKLVQYVAGEGARVLHAICHPAEFGCDNSSVPRYPYDPNKAKALLAQAGYSNGFDLDLYAYRDRNQIEAVIGYLNAVGIRAHLRFLQLAAVTPAKRSGKAALVLNFFLSQTGDISNSTATFHQFSLDDVNRDAEIRDLFRRGDTSMDPTLRKEVYAKALKLVAERAYALPLYSLTTYYLTNKDLVFKPRNDGIPRFYEMSWK